MAMNGDVLGLAIRAAVDALAPPVAGGLPAYRDDLFKAIGGAIVTHIQTFAQATVVVTNVAGVTPGGGSSGPGTGLVPPGGIT